jgi:hypothetical protein
VPTIDATCTTTDATSPDSLLLKTEPAYAARDRADSASDWISDWFSAR